MIYYVCLKLFHFVRKTTNAVPVVRRFPEVTILYPLAKKSILRIDHQFLFSSLWKRELWMGNRNRE